MISDDLLYLKLCIFRKPVNKCIVLITLSTQWKFAIDYGSLYMDYTEQLHEIYIMIIKDGKEKLTW